MMTPFYREIEGTLLGDAAMQASAEEQSAAIGASRILS
jgi:hypothetical protein